MIFVFIQIKESNKTIVMTHFAPIKLAICLIYAVMSIFQTLNSRFLYRNLGFDYYSFVFGVQRIIIILFFYLFTDKKIKTKILPKILPYSFFMCLSNILSSYCITIMPLPAFLSFKKFIVLFILALSVWLKLPNQTNNFQNLCIVGIVLGGAMVGQKDLLHGNIIGYISCLAFNLSQAVILQYSNYLYRHDSLQPEQLLLHNCAIGLPYYIGVLTYEAEFDDIFYFFKDKFSLVFLVVILLSVVLACVSELSASYIAMKISPFEKSTVANIKDLVLMIFSVSFFYDFTIGPISGIGIALCLISSILFSLPYLEQKDPALMRISSQQIGQQSSLYQEPLKIEQTISTQHKLSPKQQEDLILINMNETIINIKQNQKKQGTEDSL